MLVVSQILIIFGIFLDNVEGDDECNRDSSDLWHAFDEISNLGGYEYRQKKCFLPVEVERDAYDAWTECVWRGGTLISIHSQENLESIVGKLNDSDGSEYWIGLKCEYDSNSGEWVRRWMDESQLDFTNWDEGEPGNSSLCYTLLDKSSGIKLSDLYGTVMVHHVPYIIR